MTYNENRLSARDAQAVAEVRPEPAVSVELASDLVADIAAGRLEAWQLRLRAPLAFDLYVLGFDDGRLSLAGEVMQLEHECDRLYALLHNPQAPRRIAAQLLERQQILARRGAA